jgi:hypothetical protein
MLNKRIQRSPRVSFHVGTLYYRFMDAFNKKRLFFLLNLARQQFLSMFSWLIDCKLLQRISKVKRVDDQSVQFFKDLKFTMDKYVLHSNFCAIDMNDVDVVLGYPWIPTIGTININVEKKFVKL